MAATAQCLTVTKNADGSVQVQWDNGEGTHFSSFAEMREFALANTDARDTAQRYLLAWWLARSADGSNENLVEGKIITVDFANANPIRVQ